MPTYYRYDGTVQDPVGLAIPGASVAVLTSPSDFDSQPGSPIAAIFGANASNSATVDSASWEAGQIIFELSTTPPADIVEGSYIAVAGVTPSGYNSTPADPWLVLAVNGDNVIVAALNNPGTYVSGGAVSTSVLPNPTESDNNGNYFFYAAAGIYGVQIYGPTITERDYPDQDVGALSEGLQFADPYPFNARNYGATGNGVTDDTTSINDAIAAAAAANGTVFFPDGIYLISSTLVMPYTVLGWVMTPGATLFAGASMSYMLETDASNFMVANRIQGGQFNCNQNAGTAIFLRQYRTFYISDTYVTNCVGKPYLIGDQSLGGGYGLVMTNVQAFNPETVDTVSGSTGLYFNNIVSDSDVNNALMIGFDVGVRIGTGGNCRLTDVHVWTAYEQGAMTVAFDDSGNGTTYINCEADTPTVYGWHIHGTGCSISNSTCFVGPFGNASDDTTVAIQCDESQPFIRIINVNFEGYSGALRIANDVVFAGSPDWTGSTLFGCTWSNVVTQTLQQVYSVDLNGCFIPNSGFIQFGTSALIVGSPTMNGGALNWNDGSSNTATASMQLTGSSLSHFEFNVYPNNGTDLAIFEFFNLTNTTGGVGLVIGQGDGTGDVNHYLAGGNSQNSYLCKYVGELTIGQSGNTGVGLSVNGTIETSQTFKFTSSGVTIAVGAGAPSGGSPTKGDLYINTSGTAGSLFYIYDGSAWQDIY